jgi:hypothetical protein
MTRFIYALKEIRACLEAEILTAARGIRRLGQIAVWRSRCRQATLVRRLAPAVEWRTPTSILIAALDDLPDGDADERHSHNRLTRASKGR